MSRAIRGTCAAGVVVLLLAGCSLRELFTAVQYSDPGTGDRVVAGSLETVAQNTQGTLRRLGMDAYLTSEGDVIRVTSRTSRGDGFAVVLTRVRTDSGENTRVHIEWEKTADNATHTQILAGIDAQVSQPRQ